MKCVLVHCLVKGDNLCCRYCADGMTCKKLCTMAVNGDACKYMAVPNVPKDTSLSESLKRSVRHG